MGALRAEAIFGAAPSGALIGSAGELLESCGSTMDVARERLQAGAPDGYVVLAEHQTAGRGRDGSWECPPGRGLLMSLVLKLSLPARERKLLTIMAAVAATEAVRGFGVGARIKWPNDVVVATRRQARLRVKKLGGVVVEAVSRGDAAPAHVLGIGLNVEQAAAELPAGAPVEPTSMRLEAGRSLDRSAVCRALLEQLNAWYRRLAMGQRETLLARWRQRSCLVGCKVRARVGRREVTGTVAGIRSSGELILQDAAGRRVLLSDGTARLLL